MSEIVLSLSTIALHYLIHQFLLPHLCWKHFKIIALR